MMQNELFEVNSCMLDIPFKSTAGLRIYIKIFLSEETIWINGYHPFTFIEKKSNENIGKFISPLVTFQYKKFIISMQGCINSLYYWYFSSNIYFEHQIIYNISQNRTFINII